MGMAIQAQTFPFEDFKHLEEWMVSQSWKWQREQKGIISIRYVVNNHGDRKSPKDPLRNGLFMAYKWG